MKKTNLHVTETVSFIIIREYGTFYVRVCLAILMLNEQFVILIKNHEQL